LAAAKQACAKKPKGKDFTLLFKRDGTSRLGSHAWHGLMEIFSMYLTFDILRSNPNPMFKDADIENTQIVFLDDFPDGMFIDLWKLFAKKPIIHIDEFKKQVANGDQCLDNLIIPLPGASNPLWQGDWHPRVCHHSALLDTFVHRLLQHYKISPAYRAPDTPAVVTFIDRPTRRRLHDQDNLLEALRKKFPSVIIQAVNFREMELAERIKICTETDVLVGVHGSGLTLSVFQPKGSSVVEIQPKGFNHKGFRNLANLMRQRYFRAHAELDEGSNWQKTEEVTMEEHRFTTLMEAAIQSVLHRGVLDSDVI